MQELECSLSGLAQIDTADVDALMRMNEVCLTMLLDPTLWAWMIGLTAAFIAGGALIGWIKGRMLAGIIWAAVLGPIGWIVVALMKSRLPICPECSKDNPADAKSCRHCGVNLRVSEQRTARSNLKGNDSGGHW